MSNGRFTRRYTLREGAFDTITPESAYFAGLLMADGCISGRDAGITLAFTEDDSAHLQDFLDFVGGNHPIKVAARPGINGRSRPVAQCTIYSRQMVEALASFGVTPRKSLTAKASHMEKNAHFWRGMVCGDGDIGLLQKRYARIRLSSGSIPLIEQWRDFVLSLPCSASAHQRADTPFKNHTCWSFQATGSNGYIVIQELFKDATVALARKWDMARRILAECDPLNGSTVHDKRRKLTWRGETKSFPEWARNTGINVPVLKARIRKGWSVERTLTTPVDTSKSHRNSGQVWVQCP